MLSKFWSTKSATSPLKPGGGPADAHPHPDEIRRAEAVDDAAQAVVAGVAAAQLQPHVLPGEIELVVDDDDVLRLDLEERRRRLHAVAREVHERAGLQQRDREARAPHGDVALRPDAAELLLEVGHPVRTREMLDDHEADVVPVLLVLLARIAEPDDEVHGGASDADREVR